MDDSSTVREDETTGAQVPEAAPGPLEAELAARLQAVHAAALRKMARDPSALDVRAVSSITDVLYVCHGESTRAVDAIVEEIVTALKAVGTRSMHVEGAQSLNWVLIDAGDIMVHVFLEERRGYYNLERLWHDAPRIELAG